MIAFFPGRPLIIPTSSLIAPTAKVRLLYCSRAKLRAWSVAWRTLPAVFEFCSMYSSTCRLLLTASVAPPVYRFMTRRAAATASGSEGYRGGQRRRGRRRHRGHRPGEHREVREVLHPPVLEHLEVRGFQVENRPLLAGDRDLDVDDRDLHHVEEVH